MARINPLSRDIIKYHPDLAKFIKTTNIYIDTETGVTISDDPSDLTVLDYIEKIEEFAKYDLMCKELKQSIVDRYSLSKDDVSINSKGVLTLSLPTMYSDIIFNVMRVFVKDFKEVCEELEKRLVKYYDHLDLQISSEPAAGNKLPLFAKYPYGRLHYIVLSLTKDDPDYMKILFHIGINYLSNYPDIQASLASPHKSPTLIAADILEHEINIDPYHEFTGSEYIPMTTVRKLTGNVYTRVHVETDSIGNLLIGKIEELRKHGISDSHIPYILMHGYTINRMSVGTDFTLQGDAYVKGFKESILLRPKFFLTNVREPEQWEVDNGTHKAINVSVTIEDGTYIYYKTDNQHILLLSEKNDA